MKKEILDKLSPKAMAEIISLEKRLVEIEEEIEAVDDTIKELEDELKIKGGNKTEKWI